MALIQNANTADTLTIVPTTANSARVTLYDTAGRELSYQGKQTYMAAGTFTPPATPTDLVTITGSATKTIRVISMQISTTATANSSANFFLVKRAVVPTAGVFVAATTVPNDSNDNAGTANVGHWTTSPTAPTVQSAGIVWMKQVAVPVTTTASWIGVTKEQAHEMMPWNQNLIIYPIVLRGPAQTLAINFAAAALLAGQTHAYRVTWMEE